MPEIIECRHITGKADFIFKTATKKIPKYGSLILALPNFQNLKTSVFLLNFKQKFNLLQ